MGVELPVGMHAVKLAPHGQCGPRLAPSGLGGPEFRPHVKNLDTGAPTAS